MKRADLVWFIVGGELLPFTCSVTESGAWDSWHRVTGLADRTGHYAQRVTINWEARS